MGMDDKCTPGLILGLGFPSSALEPLPKMLDKSKPASNGFDPEPCLTLSLSGKTCHRESKGRTFDVNKLSSFEDESGCGRGDSHQLLSASSPLSGVSSFSSAKAAVKREREASSDDAEIERVSSKASDEEDDLAGGNNARKKLRLTKDQSALLEESFKQHSTLNPKQKQILARQLNLRPRQVEVWFQNRRARTKLKQTEVDCELLKKYCETLSDENRRLQKELQELKALKLAQPFYMHVPSATLTMCPSCERVCDGGGNKSPKSPFSMAQTTKPQFYAPHQFTNPSTAC